MPNIIKKLDFTTQTAADPYLAVPTGWEYSVGSQQGRTVNISAMSWTAKSVQSNIISSTPMEGVWIQSTVQLSTSQSNGSGACILDKATGNGYMITADTTNGHRVFKVVAGQLSGSSLVQVTNATTPVVNLQKHTLRRNTLTNELQILIEGSLAASVTDATYAPMYGGCQSRYGYLRYVETEYTPTYEILSINGGSSITVGQTGIPIVATGFTAKPTAVTATYASGAKSITATIDSGGTATNFNISIQDRIEAEDWPLNGDTLTFTFTYLSESASGTQTLVKKADEVVLTVSGGITSDPATWTYWLNDDGFTVEGGEHVYDPYGDLVLTADGGGSATNAGTFTSWFRPATGTGAGNVYAYTWVITEAGISLEGSGLTSSGLTVSGLTSAGL